MSEVQPLTEEQKEFLKAIVSDPEAMEFFEEDEDTIH